MLPDYPKIKEKVNDIFLKRIKRQSMPYPINKASKRKIHEGKRSKIIRADGSEDVTDIGEISSDTKEIDLREFEKLTYEDILKKIDESAKEIAVEQFNMMLDNIKETTKKTGNSINVEGKIEPENILALLEIVYIDFNKDGSLPSDLTFLIPPGAEEEIEEVIEKIKNTPELNERWNEIIKEKRREWRARENSRKLVE